MIRCAASLADIEARVDALDPKWRTKAAVKTAKFITNKNYDEKSGTWSKVKPIFMAIQSNKCVFCERQFESLEASKIEFDLEHFRPKSSVLAWPKPGTHKFTYAFGTGAGSPSGYYWLAYDLRNYAASCKPCNTNLKSNFFPIAAGRAPELGDLTAEKPFLCYPIGSADDDPETLIGFIGTTAVPKAKTGHKRRRGQVMIDFFELNIRDGLHKERATFIMLLGDALGRIADGSTDQIDRKLVDRLTSDMVPHSSCLKAFAKDWNKDQVFGRRILKACRAYVADGDFTMRPDI